ncbi:MAG: tetratricopeptide repeat protein [Acidobacteria bacterium]|nr:tetratricopeptide repeat protein [Acidobacteriota bacterium]
MNRIPVRQFFIKAALAALAVLAVLPAIADGQHTDDPRRKAATAAFSEAQRLREENTYRSCERAFAKFTEAAALFEALGDRSYFGKSLLAAGLMKDFLDDKKTAVEYYERALAVFRELDDQVSEARALNNLGLAVAELGDRQKAREYHERALELRRATADEEGEGRTLNSLGVLYAELGERKKALDCLNAALAIRRRLDETAEQAITLNNLGLLYNALGDRKKAVEHFNFSLLLRRVVDDRAGEAVTLNNLGMALDDGGETQAALEAYEKAAEIFSELGFENRKAAVFNNIGEVYRRLGDAAKTDDYARQALTLYRAAGNRSGEATALNNLAFSDIRRKDVPAALKNFNEALALARSIGEKPLEASVLGNLMLVYRQLGNPNAAVFFGKQAINLYQELRGAISELDRPARRAYLETIENQYRTLADLLIESGRFAEAEEVLAMLKDEEYAAFVRRDAAATKALERRAGLTAKEKQILAEYTRQAELTAAAAEKLRALDDRKKRLAANGEALAPDEEAEYRKLAATLDEAAAAFRLFLEKTLVKELGAGGARRAAADRALQENLRRAGPGTVALTTVVTKDRYRVIVTTPNLQVAALTEIPAAALDRKILAFREALKNPAAEPRGYGKELYDILVKPVENVLRASKAETLVWSLDGNLRYIPLAALSPDGESYLVEKYRNVVLTTPTRERLGAADSAWNALGMGLSQTARVFYPEAPDEAVTLEALPAVEEELKTIIREPDRPDETGILPGRRYLNDDFTLKNLAGALAQKRPDGKPEFSVVHLASHFRLAKNWSDSFLVLGGGQVLTLEELGRTPLVDFAGVDLVTLSACNTGLGAESNGAEIDGLAGVIQMRRGRAVLATLWEVDDAATAALMGDFYRLRRESPQITKAAALQSAQKLLLYGGATPPPAAKPAGAKFRYDRTRPFAHPVFWASFVLIGNWQ